MSDRAIRSFGQWITRAPISEPFWKGLIRSAIAGATIGVFMGLTAFGLTAITYGY